MDYREKKKVKKEVYDEDFEQHYFEPEYDEEDEPQARDNSITVFGVAWDSVTESVLRTTATNLLQAAQKYNEEYIRTNKEKSEAARKELAKIQFAHHIVNIAIFFKADKASYKGFYSLTDKITQALAQE